jgi:predicted amino acid-binding ACT domain protein
VNILDIQQQVVHAHFIMDMLVVWPTVAEPRR